MVSLLLPVLLVSQSTRPIDTWVFRSVLDGRPRMITAALHKDLWVAYDATNCGLYKAWKGEVKFEGSVYTTEHGPQPTSNGTDYWRGPTDQQVWKLSSGRSFVTPAYKGHKFVGGEVVLQFEFRNGKNRSVKLSESPMYSGANFVRTFQVSGLGRNEVLSLELGSWFGSRPIQLEGNASVIGGVLKLGNGTSLLKAALGGGRNSEETWIYPASSRNEPTLDTILRPESGDNVYADGLPVEPSPVTQNEPLTPGLALRVFWIGEEIGITPILIAGQTPNYSTVIPQVNLTKPAEFGGIDEQFYAELTGFLNISEAGTYTLRLSSDDGSLLFLGNRKVIDNDGLHGEQAQEYTAKFERGLHPIKIEYFENHADQVLKLEWKRPGSFLFELVPSSALAAPRGEVKVTSPGKKLVADIARRDRPGDGMPLAAVHPSYDLATVRPPDFRPRVGGIDFLPDGRMVICNWEPAGGVYVLDGVQAKHPFNVSMKRIAFGLAEPLGIKVVNGEIYVLQKQELTKLIDHDKDGMIDEYRCVANGWGVTANFHEFAFGLVHKDRHFYANLAIAINPGGKSTQPQNPDRGKTVKIGMDGSYEFVASGLRTPNGIGIGPGNEIFLSDNQGDWLPSSKIMHLREGAFFGSRAVQPVKDATRQEAPPVVWLPQGEIGNSPCNPVVVPAGPFKGQLMHGDVTHGGVKRVFLEKVNGNYQGCVFRFSQGLEAGINRILFGPDGSLYVGGIGSSGNWGQEGKLKYGLQRLTYNGKPAFEMFAVRAFKNGMEIELTKPLERGVGNDPADYRVRQWRYQPTVEYGGPKIDEEDVSVSTVSFSKDRKRIFLESNSLKPGSVVYLRLGRGLRSVDGELPWATEAWYTLNAIPEKSHRVTTAATTEQAQRAEAREGFKFLFDGSSLTNFIGYPNKSIPNGWRAENDVLAYVPGGEGGDLATRDEFANFELRLEWKISSGGNSGIMYRVDSSHGAPWETGPEMQVLDDDRHADGRSPLTSAGSLYGLLARNRDIVRPAGKWNDVRIIAQGSQIEHWLNGVRVVEYNTKSSEFQKLVNNSKFKSMPDFAKYGSGRIVLQDHGDKVWYRNIRIKTLP